MALAALPTVALGGDDSAGQRDFSRCAACHSAQAGKNGIGPSLAGVVGRISGGAPDYSYSTAMKNAHVTWDASTLDHFLANPQSVVRGTKMFVNIPDATARGNVIAYLATLK
jgi:cytochrome c2